MNPNVWRSDSRPFVYGHRGAPERRHENTIEGFTVAKGLGVDGVELDARRTADGRIAVHHDAHLDDGRVLCDVAEADLPGCVPGLAAALDACRGIIVNIEIKNSPLD
ncbi:MAG: glycerophosphodiester phosphodiesterase family protein, partial [Acidimicrobiales bacterium]